jgi:hypothetical protein
MTMKSWIGSASSVGQGGMVAHMKVALNGGELWELDRTLHADLRKPDSHVGAFFVSLQSRQSACKAGSQRRMHCLHQCTESQRG